MSKSTQCCDLILAFFIFLDYEKTPLAAGFTPKFLMICFWSNCRHFLKMLSKSTFIVFLNFVAKTQTNKPSLAEATS